MPTDWDWDNIAPHPDLASGLPGRPATLYPETHFNYLSSSNAREWPAFFLKLILHAEVWPFVARSLVVTRAQAGWRGLRRQRLPSPWWASAAFSWRLKIALKIWEQPSRGWACCKQLPYPAATSGPAAWEGLIPPLSRPPRSAEAELWPLDF